MDIYDQHEQSERVRSWLKDNGGAIITGVVIGLGAIFGYQQWQNYKIRQAYTAAELYGRTQPAQTADESNAEPVADTPEIEAARSQLRREYSRSGFAILTALEQARVQLDANDIDGARASLIWARDNSDEPALKTLAGVRLARVELAASNPEEALKVLDALSGDGYAAQRAELRGDAHAALGQTELAVAAYEEARTAGGSDTNRIEMKLGEYATATNPDEATATEEGEGA